MAKYRHKLPQMHGGMFLSDGGLETSLVYHEGLELPYFAAFPLLKSPEGRGRTPTGRPSWASARPSSTRSTATRSRSPSGCAKRSRPTARHPWS